jgi:hypothetical protein
MIRRTTCTAHCAACGRHFAGDTAFDMHRRGDPDRRYCVSPLDEPRLTVATEVAYCAINGEHDDGEPTTLDPVTVYGLAVNRTPAKRAAYAALRAPVCSESSSVSQHPTPKPDQSLALA